MQNKQKIEPFLLRSLMLDKGEQDLLIGKYLFDLSVDRRVKFLDNADSEIPGFRDRDYLGIKHYCRLKGQKGIFLSLSPVHLLKIQKLLNICDFHKNVVENLFNNLDLSICNDMN